MSLAVYPGVPFSTRNPRKPRSVIAQTTATWLLALGNTFLLTLPLGYYLSQHTGLAETGLWISGPVSAFVGTASLALWLATGRWARRAPHSVS